MVGTSVRGVGVLKKGEYCDFYSCFLSFLGGFKVKGGEWRGMEGWSLGRREMLV